MQNFQGMFNQMMVFPVVKGFLFAKTSFFILMEYVQRIANVVTGDYRRHNKYSNPVKAHQFDLTESEFANIKLAREAFNKKQTDMEKGLMKNAS